MMLLALIQDAVVDPSTCLALGFCPAPQQAAVAPGVMFLALGLVLAGVAGLRQRGRTQGG